MIALDRLQQIIPADQALANKALATSLQQIGGISNLTLPGLSAITAVVETTRDLPLINAQTQAVPPAVANYYTSTLATGSGPDGQIRIVDILGLAAGWIATDAFTQTVAIFNTMNLTYLTLIYQTMANAGTGVYGDTEAGPLTIPSGLPGAGTYIGTEIPPVPPAIDPTYDPTAFQAAQAVLIPIALAEILNLISQYPTQTAELNTLFNSMAEQVVREDNFQALIKLNFADLTPNDRNVIYGFILSLPQYGLQTEEGGITEFIEDMADLNTQSGQAVVATLREGKNEVVLGDGGIVVSNNIPSEPNPPPPEAVLLPSKYTTEEAAALIIK